MLLPVFIFFLTLTILYFSYCWWLRRNRPPGPWGVPILGYLPWLNPDKPYITLTHLSRKYGPVYSLSLGGVYTVVITDYKVIRRTLIKDQFTGRAPLYLTHGIMNGYGLICAQGDLWKDQRKFVSGCLRNFGAVKSASQRDHLENIIQDGVLELLRTLKEGSTPDITLNILSPLRHCLGNVVNMFVFGYKWSADDDVWNWLQILQEEGTKLIGVAGPINFLPFMRHLPTYRRAMDFLMDGKIKTHKVYKKLIDEHIQSLKETPLEYSQCRNLIDAFLLEKEKRFSSNDPGKDFYCDAQFYHLLADVFGASLDTTLATLRWYFLLMAAFPQEQARVQEELDYVLNGRMPAVDDMASLPFVNAAIAETQRVRSTIPVGIPHGTVEDTEIEGFKVPKGTMVVPLQWAVHMDPRYWANPELYNPSRFLDAEGKFFKPDCFMPFQTGKRICVGMDLAQMLLFLFGASVVQQFRISCPIDETIDLNGECGITLNPKNHVLVFTPRHNNNARNN